MNRTTIRSLALSIASIAALGASAIAGAHTEKPHAGKAAAVLKEQKPWGIAGDRSAVRKTIAVGMSDAMRFTPASIQVRKGDTIRFVLRNDGKVMHEFVIGTKQENDNHAALMIKFPKMEHDEPYMAHVAPSKSGEIIWLFNRPGDFDFACLIAGHYQAGMVGRIRVVPAAGSAGK